MNREIHKSKAKYIRLKEPGLEYFKPVTEVLDLFDMFRFQKLIKIRFSYQLSIMKKGPGIHVILSEK